MMQRVALTLVVCSGLAILSAQQSSGAVLVDGRANIFGAGLDQPPGVAPGILPPFISIPVGTWYVTFPSVTGAVSFDVWLPGTRPFFGPDGGDFAPGTAPGLTDIESLGGISGIKHDKNTFLAGVFLGDDAADDPAPAVLDFSHAGDFFSLFPVLHQTFFIGDGLTGTGTGEGAVQRFYVPRNATRLFLGLVDGFDQDTLTISGAPRFYNDNGGEFFVRSTFHPVPAPSSLAALLGIGALAAIPDERRKQAKRLENAILAVLAVRAGWEGTPPVQVLPGNGTFRDGNDTPLDPPIDERVLPNDPAAASCRTSKYAVDAEASLL